MTIDFSYEPVGGRVVFARGSITRIGDELDRLGSRRAILIAESRNADVADLDDRIIGHIDTVAQHVPLSAAEPARVRVRDANADTIVVVGGGSSLGLSKAVALEVDVHQIAVPTTYAGSEQTSIWGLTDAGSKRTGRAQRVKPDVVLYDPDLSETMPGQVAGPSGLNAVAHCVEAMYGPCANPVTTMLAAEGVAVLADSLPAVVAGEKGTGDPAAAALYGSYLAGVALNTAGVGLHHKTCHVLGGMFDLDHGKMNAVVLGHAVAYNAPMIPEVLDRLEAALGINDAPMALFKLAERIGAPTSLRSIGMPADGIEPAVDRIVEEAEANIRAPERAGIRAMLTRAFHGDPPVTDRG